MARTRRDPSINQKNDASSIGNKRQMAKRAKRHSNKQDRQNLQKDLEKMMNEKDLEKMMNDPIELD